MTELRGDRNLISSARRKRVLRLVLISTSFLIVAGLIASWLVAGALVAPCPRVIGDPPSDLNATAFTIASDSGSTISGWHTKPQRSDGVVVLVHGIRGSRLLMLDRARLLHSEGYATVMIDLQAHGESSGDVITAGHLEKHDVRAAVEYARREHLDESIGVIGVSLGGAAAVLGSPLDVDALVIESVYPDIDAAIHNRVAARLGPFASLPSKLLLMQLESRLGISRSQLRPIDGMPAVGCPVLVSSGTHDRHTTVSQTKSLFDAALAPKELWLVDGAAHVDLHRFDPGQYAARTTGFLGRHLRLQKRNASPY